MQFYFPLFSILCKFPYSFEYSTTHKKTKIEKDDRSTEVDIKKTNHNLGQNKVNVRISEKLEEGFANLNAK